MVRTGIIRKAGPTNGSAFLPPNVCLRLNFKSTLCGGIGISHIMLDYSNNYQDITLQNI